MPGLLDLSNELLYTIIDQIHPDDIPNFSLTCKHLHHVAADVVQLHLDREDYYEDVVIHGCYRHENNAHPLPLIEEMCMDWRIGEYVKTLTVECCGPPQDTARYPEQEDEEDAQEYQVRKREDSITTGKIMPSILNYIREIADAWCMPPPNCFGVEAFCSEAKKGERSAMIALLLLFFLPNLEAIRLSRYTWDPLYLKNAILLLSERDPQHSSRARKPFFNLRQVEIRGSCDDLRGENVEVFIWFAALPSMRKLYGSQVGGHWHPVEQWTIPLHTSNVTDIRLLKSAIHYEYLEQLLVGIRSLERFTYQHNEEMAEGNGFDAHKFFTALLQHAKHSLKFLAMFGVCALREEEDVDDDAIDLQGFRVLEELRLNIWIYKDLLPYRKAPDGRRTREDFRPLVYALPPSVKIASFSGTANFLHVAALFIDFAEKKHLRLPNLQKVRVRGHYTRGNDEDWAQLKEMCEHSAVTLETHWI